MRTTLLSFLLLLFGGAAISAPAGAPHGAESMSKQQVVLTAQARGATPVATAVPAGIDPSYWSSLIAKDNALTEARIALGRKLYFDQHLSKDGTVACATCHDVTRGFTDRRGTSEGIGDKLGRRNAPTVLNAVFNSTQFWDGRAASLEEQAKLPIINPIEMGMPDGAAATAAIAGDADYQKMFQAAYGRAPNYEDIGRALGAFERTLVYLDAPFDRFAAGDAKAISDDAKAGWALFNGKARCVSCHQMSSASPVGTDGRFHNVGVSAKNKDFEKLASSALTALDKDASKEAVDKLALQTDLSELGRFVVTRNRADIGAFKTSQIRNIGVTAPYMHDGSLPTLWDVMDHYNKGGEVNAYLDGGVEPLKLSEQEINQVVAFLFSLTDVRLADQNKAEEARQRKLSLTSRPDRDVELANRTVFPFERRVTGAKPKGAH